jgi:hypothetical protein
MYMDPWNEASGEWCIHDSPLVHVLTVDSSYPMQLLKPIDKAVQPRDSIFA